MTNNLTTKSNARAILLPDAFDHDLRTAQRGARRAIASRLGQFADWLDATGRPWLMPDLAQYRDHLLREGKAPTTVNTHLSTIRSRYTSLLSDNTVIAMLDEQAAAECIKQGWEVSPANITALVERATATVRNAINPKTTAAKMVVKQLFKVITSFHPTRPMRPAPTLQRLYHKMKPLAICHESLQAQTFHCQQVV